MAHALHFRSPRSVHGWLLQTITAPSAFHAHKVPSAANPTKQRIGAAGDLREPCVAPSFRVGQDQHNPKCALVDEGKVRAKHTTSPATSGTSKAAREALKVHQNTNHKRSHSGIGQGHALRRRTPLEELRLKRSFRDRTELSPVVRRSVLI